MSWWCLSQPWPPTHSAKANGREPKSCLGRIFNFKLGHFVMYAIAWHIQTCLSFRVANSAQVSKIADYKRRCQQLTWVSHIAYTETVIELPKPTYILWQISFPGNCWYYFKTHLTHNNNNKVMAVFISVSTIWCQTRWNETNSDQIPKVYLK